MKMKPRFSKNKGSDLLRFSLAGLAFIAVFSIYWNRASIPLGDVESGYQGFILQSEQYQGRMLNEEGVAVLRAWVEEKSSPTLNPFIILRHNIAYRHTPSRYPLVIGLQGMEGARAFREYGIYQDGRTIYLRIEPIGSDRVLRTTFTTGELEEALSSYIEGEFKLAQPENSP